jgi:tRNA threonylcarbamoyl adenosine modification protein YeaZ
MIFLIDSTTNPTAIGLWDGAKLHTKIIESNPENNRKLISLIEKFGNSLKIKNWKLKIDSIGVIRGPGTFTGVRTGVVIANAFGYALKAPIYALDTLFAQMPRMITDVVSLISASNSEVYFARFNRGKMVEKIELVDAMNLANRLNDSDIIVGDLQEKHCGLITKQEFENVTSADRIKNLLDLILCKKIKPAKQVLPLYIKKPNITHPKKK